MHRLICITKSEPFFELIKEKKGGCLYSKIGGLIKNIIIERRRLFHSRNNFARNITNIFSPIWSEKFTQKKCNQVESDGHDSKHIFLCPNVLTKFEIIEDIACFFQNLSTKVHDEFGRFAFFISKNKEVGTQTKNVSCFEVLVRP